MDILTDLISTIPIICGVIVIYILARFNYQIRKLKLEKGITPVNYLAKSNLQQIGSIVISLGIGLGLSSIFTVINLKEDTFYFLVYATTLTCGGIGLLIAHQIRKTTSSNVKT